MWYYREKANIDDFDEKEKYTNSQLEAFATSLLKNDRKESKESHGILFDEQLDIDKRREVLVDASEIDGTLTQSIQDNERPGTYKGDGQRIFWRRHPQGRKVNSNEARSRGASYFS